MFFLQKKTSFRERKKIHIYETKVLPLVRTGHDHYQIFI